MDKLMILGAGKFQLDLIKTAQNMGCYVIVVSPDGDYPGLSIADKVVYQDATDEEKVYEIAKEEKIDGIISDQAEIFVKPISYVSEKLNLPGNPYEVACRYTDKYEMRKCSHKAGLPTIRAKRVSQIEDAIEFFEDLTGDAIIKPVDGFSSKGVYKITSREDIENKFYEALSYSKKDKVIIEEFIKGRQFEVDSIAVNGEVSTLMYADLDEFDINDVFSSKTRLYPSVADKSVIDKLLEYNIKVNRCFGLKQGLTHNEYILDEKTGEIYLIEAALRGGGTYIASHISMLETGVDTAEFLVNISLGRIKKIPSFQMNRCHAGYVCFYLPAGEIIGASGIEAVENLEYVDKTTLERVRTGSVSDDIKDKDQRQAIILHASTRNEILDRIEVIKSLLKIQVKTENGIEGPIWD